MFKGDFHSYIQTGGQYSKLAGLHEPHIIAVTSVPTTEGLDADGKQVFGLGGNGSTELSKLLRRLLHANLINSGSRFREMSTHDEGKFNSAIHTFQGSVGKRVDHAIQVEAAQHARKGQRVVVESKLYEVLAVQFWNRMRLSGLSMLPIALETDAEIATIRTQQRRKNSGQAAEYDTVRQDRVGRFATDASEFLNMYNVVYEPRLIRECAALVIDNSEITPPETAQVLGLTLQKYAPNIPHAFISALLNA